MSNRIKWTAAARQLLYEQLVSRFGPHGEWEARERPGRGHDESYEQFCNSFAQLIGAESARAVKHQISFAIPIQRGGIRRWKQGHARSAILNLAAAFEAGFVGANAFPALVASAASDGPVLVGGHPAEEDPEGITNWPPEPHYLSEPERWHEVQRGNGQEGEDQ
jgi:hypothetical protein